jgi:hypothetical protein
MCMHECYGRPMLSLDAFSFFFVFFFVFFVHARPRLPYGGSVENMSRLPMTGA